MNTDRAILEIAKDAMEEACEYEDLDFDAIRDKASEYIWQTCDGEMRQRAMEALEELIIESKDAA